MRKTLLFAGALLIAASTSVSAQEAVKIEQNETMRKTATPQTGFIPAMYSKANNGEAKSVEEGFEGGVVPPECWSMIDADGDGQNWFALENEEYANTGSFTAASASWTGATGPLTPDNYLVSPQLSVGAGESLSFFISAIDPNWFAEQYQVLVSTTGNEAADFTDELVTETLEDATQQERSYDLSAYEGQEIYIAWRHFGVTDFNAIALDDVVLPGEIINCCTNDNLPTFTSEEIICDVDQWSLELGITPAAGLTYSITTNEGDDVAVADEGVYTFGPYPNGAEIVFTLNVDGLPECTQEIGVISGDCTEPCEDIATADPYDFFDQLGVPTPDENGLCEAVTVEIPIWASESYILSGLPENTLYTFSSCEGTDAGTWDITYTVFDPAGTVVEFGTDDDGCSITWNTEAGGDFIVGITRVGYCGTAQDINNGFPSLTCDGVVGTQDLESVDAKIFPNPTAGNINVVTPLQGDAQINVFDAVGRVVLSERSYLSNANFELGVSELAKGTYILQITTDERVATTRFVKN